MTIQSLPYKLNQLKLKIMKKLVYGYFECLNLSEIASLIDECKVNETMAYVITNGCGSTFKFYGYGTFNGDAEDWGFEDATCGMFQGEKCYEEVKHKYEVMKSNGEFKED